MYDYKWDEEHYNEVFGKKKYHLGDRLVFIGSIICLVVVIFFMIGDN
jgi:hypothetical protein